MEMCHLSVCGTESIFVAVEQSHFSLGGTVILAFVEQSHFSCCRTESFQCLLTRDILALVDQSFFVATDQGYFSLCGTFTLTLVEQSHFTSCVTESFQLLWNKVILATVEQSHFLLSWNRVVSVFVQGHLKIDGLESSWKNLQLP